MTDELELPELDSLTLAVRYLITASQEFSARTSRELGVNTTDMAALALLELHGPMSPVELAASLGIRSASVTVLIDRLERAGHVERVRSESDRRRITVTTTPAAHQASLAAVLPAILAIDRISRSLSADDQQVVHRFLDAVTQVMHGGARGPRPPTAR